MSVLLTPGGNTAIPDGPLTITINYTPTAGVELDISAFLLGSDGKVRGDEDMCFYGQQELAGGALTLTEILPDHATFRFHPSRLDSRVEKVALSAAIYENKAQFSKLSRLYLQVINESKEVLEAQVSTASMQETALILGEFYRRQGAWKFRFIAQGFIGGLPALVGYFGVEVAPTPPPAKPPEPQKAKLNLDKISLDKTRSSISLDKVGNDYGEIKINLNWSRAPISGGGLVSSFREAKEVDLDVGSLYELQNGQKGAIQALGNGFGKYTQEPYIELMGDDRTGAVSDGEWIRINGKYWPQIKRVLVYAFIYDGVPNWRATDGVVTLYAPGQPPIEVKMSEEGGGAQIMCSVALLENIDGKVKISRQVRFFQDQQSMDRAYNWGMTWRTGSK
jgi:tellurite resistance protein TerA